MVPLALAFFLGVCEKTNILKPMNTIIMQIALSTMIRFIQRIEQAVIIIIIVVVLPSCINITSISLLRMINDGSWQQVTPPNVKAKRSDHDSIQTGLYWRCFMFLLSLFIKITTTRLAYNITFPLSLSVISMRFSIMGNKVSLEEELINLKIVSKQMVRSSKKCEKNEKAAIEKLKKVCVLCVCLYEYIIRNHV
jgi:hypothetical protein